MIKFEIPGEPTGKGRARVTKFGTYTPEKTVNYEALIKHIYTYEKQGKMFEGPLEMKVIAYFSIPKSVTKGKRELMGVNKIRPTKKPDADNILKIVCDSLNGIAYKDDTQVVTASITKLYTIGNPIVVVEIKEVA